METKWKANEFAMGCLGSTFELDDIDDDEGSSMSLSAEPNLQVIPRMEFFQKFLI